MGKQISKKARQKAKVAAIKREQLRKKVHAKIEDEELSIHATKPDVARHQRTIASKQEQGA